MYAKLSGTTVTIDNNVLGYQKNNLVNSIAVEVDTDDDWTYKLDIKYTQKDCSGKELYNIINLNRVGNLCSALLTMTMLPFSGRYIMQLRGINGQQIYHSEIFEVWVKYSIDPASVYTPVPSEFYQIEGDITEINNNPPIPDNSGFWKIWNSTTHQYELSDIKLPEAGGNDKSFEFTQNTPAKVWVIQHNLYKRPSVTVVDSGENEIIGDVEYIDLNTVKLTFEYAFSGKAYLN